jgi:hypothetical protein
MPTAISSLRTVSIVICAVGLGQATMFGQWSCVEQFRLPQYPPLARQARLTGTVHLQAMTGKDGRTTTRITTTGRKLLKEAVEQVASSLIIARECGARVISIHVSFELDEKERPKSHDSGSHLIVAPDRLVVRAPTFPLSGETVLK